MSAGWGRRLLAVVAVFLMAVGVGTAIASSARAAGATGTVYVLHAIQGETVDVFVDGKNVCPAAKPKIVVGPLDLAAGSHTLELKKGSTSLLSTKFSVKAGTSADIVAHRRADASGTPTATVFPNDVTPIGPGKARLVVTHVASAPPADIVVDGKPIFRNVANGESLMATVPARSYKVKVVPTTGGDPILDTVTLSLPAGKLTRVFAIGDPKAGTADAIVQNLKLKVVGAKQPTSVQTGDGGQAAALFGAGGPLSTGASVAVALGGLVLLAASRVGVGRAAGSGVGSRHAR